MGNNMIDGLHSVGMDLAAARAALDAQTEIARNAARVAAAAGVSERRIAAELGVARSKTVRRWLGKA
jgi:transposase